MQISHEMEMRALEKRIRIMKFKQERFRMGHQKTMEENHAKEITAMKVENSNQMTTIHG